MDGLVSSELTAGKLNHISTFMITANKKKIPYVIYNNDVLRLDDRYLSVVDKMFD